MKLKFSPSSRLELLMLRPGILKRDPNRVGQTKGAISRSLFFLNRQVSQLLLLRQLHDARLPPPDRHGAGHDRLQVRIDTDWWQ